MSNVASRTYKKRGFCSCGGGLQEVVFGPNCAWASLSTFASKNNKNIESFGPKVLSERLPPEGGNSMAWRAQGHRFSRGVGVIFNVKRRVQTILQLWGSIKKDDFAALHLQLALRCTSTFQTSGTKRSRGARGFDPQPNDFS